MVACIGIEHYFELTLPLLRSSIPAISPYVWGLFKKRPNFVISTPTNTESALRLQSAPSVRVWLQTAICPVSLCAFVLELHPLNWARAQAVCRISNKVTMKELEEQRVCVKFCCKLDKNITETFQLLNQAEGG